MTYPNDDDNFLIDFFTISENREMLDLFRKISEFHVRTDELDRKISQLADRHGVNVDDYIRRYTPVAHDASCSPEELANIRISYIVALRELSTYRKIWSALKADIRERSAAK